MPSLSEPGFLLASPSLGDPSFAASVVALAVHDEGGALGFTVNGEALASGAALVRALGLATEDDPLPIAFDAPVRRGGPVSSETVWILYRNVEGEAPLPGSIPVGASMGVTPSIEALRALLAGSRVAFRLLAGYAGWGPGQLERELSEGSWLPSPAEPSLVFDRPDDEAADTFPRAIWHQAYALAIGAPPGAFVSSHRGSA